MISAIYKIKKNKLLFSLCVLFVLVIIFDFATILINVVQILKTASNPASLFGGFLVLNIVCVSANVLLIMISAIYLIVRRFKVF